MKLCSFLDSPISFRGVPISIFQRGSSKSSTFLSPFTQVGSCRNYPDARKLKNCHLRAQLSPGTKISISSSSVEPIPETTPGKDGGVVFVAGATGRVGSRTVRELLKLGFRVRAGVRNVQRADPLVQSVKQIKFDTETAGEGSQPVERLEIVQCDLESPDQIGRALGNASVVICCIGASEKEVFDVTGPYRIDYIATKNLINAATTAKVDHFILVSSLGTNKVGFPAAILNLFWGVLIWKRKAEEALVTSGIPYTIVRPGGMERPTDSFKETHNITLHEEDTKFGGLVSNLQIAELMAFMAKNRTLSYCKVVEVIAETTVPLRPFGEQLQKIPCQRPVPPEALDASSETVAVISESSVPDVVSSLAENEPTKEETVIKRPLSPYTAYEDLKPPTSPIPIQPSRLKQKEDTGTAKPDPNAFETSFKALQSTAEEPVQVVKNQPLSPYTAYADLKPPSSPSPVAPTTTKKFEGTSSSSLSEVEAPAPPSLGNNNDAVKLEKSTNGAPESANGPPEALMNNLSPYPVYSDLKPPTSPSPNAPVSAPSEPEKPIDNVSVDTPEPIQPENADDRVSADITESTQPEKTKDEPASSSEPKARPLSPFTMYADMKPPTTPSPSPKKEH